ncbi:cytochrome P450 [Frankia canadensis]|uniref:cytochrome P450 n=1 Tax=Frankia canadensis TaxID=1836972 RepID=UPI001402DD44|nr:cytochrome P450 [Frankia canadensis]
MSNRDRLVEHLQKPGEDIEPRYARWAEERRRCPVAKTSPAEGSGPETYVVYSNAGVRQVMGDDRCFTKPGPSWRTTRTLLSMNGEEHRVHRALVADPFTVQGVARFEKTLIVPLIHDLVDKFVSRGEADLVLDFTSHYPFHVIRRIIGIDESEHDEFIGLAFPVNGLNRGWEDHIKEFLLPRIHAARANPKDDVLGLLARSELDGRPLTDEDFLEYLLLLIPAGADTTVAGSSNMFAGLLLHPEQLELVRRDRGLVNRAVNEALRWQNPAATTFLRRSLCPVEVEGVAMPENTLIRAHVSAHNRDETVYAEPDRYDVTRERAPAGVFGYGPHICLGMHLARAEMRVALNVALDRLPHLRLDPSAPRPFVRPASGPDTGGDGSLAAVNSLPVLFDPPA